jgi:TetR/AcrR family transcriptional repressor of nem operon
MTIEQNDQSTAARILDVAEGLVQRRGFNGFSYAHIAAELGITTASLHYHFRGKAELGEALVARYAERFALALDAIDGTECGAADKLAAYADLYSVTLRDERMCLCGMLAAEYETLPEPMGRAIARFFDANRTWLASVLIAGRADDTLAFDGDPGDGAQCILAGFEGAMLVARPYSDPERFDAVASRILAMFAKHPRINHRVGATDAAAAL